MHTDNAPVLRVRRLDERASIPSYQTEHAAGLDLAACLPRAGHEADALSIPPGGIVKVPTGIAVEIPIGFEGQVRPRSGLATRYGLTLPNTPGTIDADYRGEVFVAMINLGPESVPVRHGDRIAQLVIAPVARAKVLLVEELRPTQRGEGGFGSTGVGR